VNSILFLLVLPQYFRHCAENPNTMMTRFFGMYRVKMYHLRRNVKFVIMNSVYYTDKHLQTFYDLKGSALGRDAKPGQAVKKDNDLRRGMPGEALALRPNARQRVRGQIESDCDFLRDMGIMDYSMLVGVHHKQAEKDPSTGSVGFKGMLKSGSIRARAHTAEAAKAGPFRPPLPLNQAMAAATIDAPDPMPKVHEKAALEKYSSERRAPQSENQAAYFFDDGLDDDDSSYLLGSDLRPNTQQPSLNEDTERKKKATIENLYWPFHRLYDIHGNRLMEPPDCSKCSNKPCTCDNDPILKGYNIPKFIAPVSERKDGGLEMETAGLRLPIQVKSSQGEVQLYDGKIFYMGIIDILQEYNSRKAFETKYRNLQAHGKMEASCVRPKDYGDRFLAFFDEYSQRKQEAEDGVELDISEYLELSSRDLAESSAGLSEHARDVP
jgi:1-phosphatidylinositol-4-phosphate 5-kinase